MQIDKIKGFFAIGFGVEKMYFFWEGKSMVYAVKIFLGFHVVNLKIHTGAYRRYEKHLKTLHNTTGDSAK